MSLEVLGTILVCVFFSYLIFDFFQKDKEHLKKHTHNKVADRQVDEIHVDEICRQIDLDIDRVNYEMQQVRIEGLDLYRAELAFLNSLYDKNCDCEDLKKLLQSPNCKFKDTIKQLLEKIPLAQEEISKNYRKNCSERAVIAMKINQEKELLEECIKDLQADVSERQISIN